MARINKIYKDIYLITQKLSELSLLKVNNFPIINGNLLIWRNYKWISYELKKEDYKYIYDLIIENENYNFILLDGWIIQMMYKFSWNWKNIESHRLTYYPNINTIQLWEDPEEYEERIYWMRMFWDLIYKDNVSTPIRFDFNLNDPSFKEYDHSYSHLTFWWYKNCRITVSSPLTPFQFILFIIKSFYYEKYIEYKVDSLFLDTLLFDESITKNEKNKLYIKL